MYRTIALRVNSAIALGEIRSQPEIAIPALIAALNDPSVRVQGFAARALGEFGTNATSAVRPLLALIRLSDVLSPPLATNQNSSFKWTGLDTTHEAAEALKKIDPKTAAKAGVK